MESVREGPGHVNRTKEHQDATPSHVALDSRQQTGENTHAKFSEVCQSVRSFVGCLSAKPSKFSMLPRGKAEVSSI